MDIIKENFELDVVETSYSSMRNPSFLENIGVYASTIYLDNSVLQLFGTNSDPNFRSNFAPYGQTITLTFS